MTDTQTTALVVALVAPVIGALLVPARGPGRADPAPPRRAQVGATVAAAAWMVLVAGGAGGSAGTFHVTPLVAAAGCGVALLGVAGLEGVSSRRTAIGTGVAISVLGVGLTAGETGPHALALLGALAAATVLTIGTVARSGHTSPPSPAEAHAPRATRGRLLGADGRLVGAVLATAGISACAVGFVAVHGHEGVWTLPTGGSRSIAATAAFMGAAALLSAAGAFLARGPTCVLLAAGLAVGLSASPVAGTDELPVVVVGLAAAAVVAAGTRQGALSIAFLALAAGAGPGALTPSSRLLAAAAVIAAAVDMRWAWLAALPGAVTLAAGVIDDGSRVAMAVALATAVVAALLGLVASERPDRYRPGPAPGTYPALGVGAWLVLAPGTWTWTGAGLDAYDLGMARGLGAGLLAVVAWVLLGSRNLKAEIPLVATPGPPQDRPPQPALAPAPEGPPVGLEPSLTPAAPPAPAPQLVPSQRSASTPRPRRALRSQRSRPRRRFFARPRGRAEKPRPENPRSERRRTTKPGPAEPRPENPRPEKRRSKRRRAAKARSEKRRSEKRRPEKRRPQEPRPTEPRPAGSSDP